MLDKIRNSFPWLELLCVDSGYNAHQVDAAVAKIPSLRIQIVKRSDDIKGFVLRPPRWVVKKAFSWVGRIRRLAKGWENLAAPLQAFVALVSIQIAIRRLFQGVFALRQGELARAAQLDAVGLGAIRSRIESYFSLFTFA